jgi:epoxyqueuosine reductase
VREDPGNRLERLDGSPIFQPPPVGFVSGSDPIFGEIKQVFGEFHMTPLEAVEKIAEGRGVAAPPQDRIGIVSFILPVSNETRRENAKTKNAPSERWAHTRLFGEQFNKKLQQHLVSVLEQKGYFVAAPGAERRDGPDLRSPTRLPGAPAMASRMV